MKTQEGLSAARFAFKVTVLALDRDCIARWESDCEGEVQAHHVLTQQQLRRYGLEVLLWDPANGAAVCERHHRRHHNRSEPLAQAILPQRCLDFAAAHHLDYLIDRFYRLRA